MKKMRLAIASIALLAVSANAGKNFVPATVEPIPVPVEPVVMPAAYIPLGLYLGGGFTYASSECKCADLSLQGNKSIETKKGTTYGVNLKAGYVINNFLAVEAKYIYTPWGDKDRTLKHYGIYLKPTYAVTENLDIYALLGYGKTECETLRSSQSGFAWGAGAEYTLNKKVNGMKDGLGVYVEYVRPLKKTGNKDITVDMINAGVSYNF